MDIFYIPSSGGGQLHCRKWLPEERPKAVVQIVHGIAEHIGRYDHFARFLNQHGYIVTAEDHFVTGGLGSAVAEVIAGKPGAGFARVGVEDRFGQSGSPAKLYEEYGLTAENIAAKVKALL